MVNIQITYVWINQRSNELTNFIYKLLLSVQKYKSQS
jgi:hypothetical protein